MPVVDEDGDSPNCFWIEAIAARPAGRSRYHEAVPFRLRPRAPPDPGRPTRPSGSHDRRPGFRQRIAIGGRTARGAVTIATLPSSRSLERPQRLRSDWGSVIASPEVARSRRHP